LRPLSVAIVCKNEEDRIRPALESVSFADEIVVVDSGSTDRTLEIAKEYTDKVMFREWKGWKDQKSWAAAQCANDWVLTLDSDEVVSEELRKEIKEVLSRDNIEEAGFTLPRATFYQGRWIRHSGWYPDRKLRLYLKERANFGGEDPHEVIEVDGTVGHLSGDLCHYTYRDLKHQADQLVRYALVNARAKYEKGERAGVLDLVWRPPLATAKMYILKLGFLDGVPGLIIAGMNGYYTLIKYARLWEMDRGANRDG